MAKTPEQRLQALEADMRATRLFLAEWMRHRVSADAIEAWHDRLVARIESAGDDDEDRAALIVALDRLASHLAQMARLTQQRPPPGS